MLATLGRSVVRNLEETRHRRSGLRWPVVGDPKGRPEAIVRPKAGRQAFDVQRIAPSADLAEFVDYYGLVRWHVPEPYRQQVIPQPQIHIAAEDGRLLVHGVSREPFFRTLTGDGHALGAAFHPGGFRPLLKSSVGTLSGTVRPGADALGHDDRAAAAAILGSDDADSMVATFDAYLLSTEPEPDPA